MDNKEGNGRPQEISAPRRRFLWAAVIGALTASYGFITAVAVSFTFPRQRTGAAQRIFIGFTHELGIGESKSMPLPSGDQLIVSNTGNVNAESGSTIIGFSNQCPHLGCKVHWESQAQRFFCPCHQGVFNPTGVAISGPPAQANQKLRAYPIEVNGNSMYAVVEES